MTYSARQMSAIEEGKFAGFEVPDASFIWCPNQFFDTCLVNNSRGVVRLVGYVLYETLKWINEDGEPNIQDVSVPFTNLICDAGVSRGAVRLALESAENANFIELVEKGRAKSVGDCGVATRVKLKWSASDEYTRNPSEFDGFFARRGNRTQIPHSFFTWALPSESLGVIKVIGTVLRHTVGWETQFGTRVKQAALSRDFIRQYAKINSDDTTERSIKRSIAGNYLVCVERGSFVEKRAAVYAPKWLATAKNHEISSKNGAKRQFKKRSEDISKNGAKGQFKNRSDIKNPETKRKQQKQFLAVVAMLCDFGFDENSAKQIAANNPHSIIKQQLEWMPLRPSHNNKLGFARRAIEQNWSKPIQAIEGGGQSKWQPNQLELESQQKAIRQKRRAALLAPWSNASEADRRRWQQQAIEAIDDPIVKQCLSGTVSQFDPPKHFLNQMAIELGLPQIEQAVPQVST